MAKALRNIYGPISGLIIDGPKGFLRGSLNLAMVAIAGPTAAISQLIGFGSSLLSPSAKAPSTSEAVGDRFKLSINLRAARTIVLGSTGMATDVRDQEFTQDGTYLHRFVVVASHRVHAIRQIWFDDKLAWTVEGGAQGEFKPWLQVTPVLEGSADNAIYVSPRMGLSRRYTGLAYIYLRYTILAHSKKLDSVFNTSIPSRVTIIGDGAPVYDPRLDSTVPGGSGPMRADDQSTWAWSDAAARNPVLQILFYLLGWRIRNPRTGAWKLAVGKGMPANRLDLASFITAANLCDEPAAIAAGGSEPRYRSDGIFSEGDDPQLVLDNLKSAANATLDDVDGRTRITVLHNDLATPIGELETADVLGAFTWNQTAPLSDCINVIRGAYTDPSTSSLYQAVDAPEVRIDSVDGIDRIQTVNQPVVQSPSQWQRLAKQRVQRGQFGGTFTAVFQATAWKFQKNDAIRFTFGPLGWYQKLFRIAEITTQVDGTVPMVLREEDPAIYAHDGTDAAAIVSAPPAVYDPKLWPILAGLVDVDARLALVFSDNVITNGREKRETILNWSSLESAYNATEAQWQAIGAPADIATQRNDARDAVGALALTLSRLQPAWDDVTQDTPIDGALLNAQWITARNRVEVFASAIRGRPGIDGEPGEDGTDGFVVDVDQPFFAIPVFSSGASKPSWTGGAGTIRLRKGDALVTAGVSYAIEDLRSMAGASVNGSRFSFSGITADTGSFIVTATYAGATYRTQVDVKKVYDGSAAFRGSVVIQGDGAYPGAVVVGSGTTPIPGGSTVTLSGNIAYSPPEYGSQSMDFTGQLSLYYRNETDNGPMVFAGQTDGSTAYRHNVGTPTEPEFDQQAGEVSASFQFASAATDKIYHYEARFGSRERSPAHTIIGGGMRVEVTG